MIRTEVDRLMPEGALTTPTKANAGGGEWDWFYQLAPVDRHRVRRHCRPGGLAPDTCAHAAGFDYVNEWAAELVAAVQPAARNASRVDDRLAPQDVVSAQEVADMCGVALNTVYVWIKRNRLPPPWATVGGIRLWGRTDIETWALETKRLTQSVDPGF